MWIDTLKVCPTKEILSAKKIQKYAKVVVGQKDNGDPRKITQL
jgi:hypothetical protein